MSDGMTDKRGQPEEEIKPNHGLKRPKAALSTPHAKRMPGTRNANSDVGLNPKDLMGSTKVDMTVIPPTALPHLAFAMMDGAYKYGPYNWRIVPVQARTYVSAAMRHLLDWLDGEEYASDSLAHHLGHAMACCAILLDAQAQSMLVDDRPVQVPQGQPVATILDELAERIKELNAARENNNG